MGFGIIDGSSAEFGESRPGRLHRPKGDLFGITPSNFTLLQVQANFLAHRAHLSVAAERRGRATYCFSIPAVYLIPCGI